MQVVFQLLLVERNIALVVAVIVACTSSSSCGRLPRAPRSLVVGGRSTHILWLFCNFFGPKVYVAPRAFVHFLARRYMVLQELLWLYCTIFYYFWCNTDLSD